MIAALWSLPFVLLTWFWLALVRRQRRARLARVEINESALKGYRFMLTHWLSKRAICQAMIDRGVATKEGLENILKIHDAMSEPELRATVAVLTSDRIVRRVIAKESHRALDLPEDKVRQGLLDLHEQVAG